MAGVAKSKSKREKAKHPEILHGLKKVGDMLLTEEQFNAEFGKDVSAATYYRNGIVGERYRWKKNTIPYKFYKPNKAARAKGATKMREWGWFSQC